MRCLWIDFHKLRWLPATNDSSSVIAPSQSDLLIAALGGRRVTLHCRSTNFSIADLQFPSRTTQNRARPPFLSAFQPPLTRRDAASRAIHFPSEPHLVPPPRQVTLVLLVAMSSPAATVCEHRPRRLTASHSQCDCTLPQLRRMRSPAFCTTQRLHLCKTTSDHLESAARCRLQSPAIHRRRPISSRHDDRFRRLRACTRLRRTAANSGGFNRSATATVGLWPVSGVRCP